MISIICLKEIRGHLKSPVFLIGMILVVFLSAYATYVGANDYRQRRDDCLAARASTEVKPHRYYLFRDPNPMSIFAQGYDTRAGTVVTIRPGSIPVQATGYMGIVGTSQAERYDTGFLSIDYTFVIRIILSLLTIFLMYDVIAGEQRRETLKLMLSNSIPRGTVLFGKMLGGWFIVIALLTIASGVSLAIVLGNPGIYIGTEGILRFLGIYAASVLYLTVFFALGLWMSVIVKRPSTALLGLLVIWVTITEVVPTLGGVIAERVVRPPSEEQLVSMRNAALQSTSDAYTRALDEWASTPPNNPAYIQIKNRFCDIEIQRANQMYAIDRIWLNALDRQTSLAAMLTMISPAAVYDQAVTRIAGTSPEEYSRFLDYVREMWKTVCAATRLPKSKEAKRILDSIKPYRPDGIRTGIAEAAVPLGILGLLSLMFFSLAYVSFLRKDVRS